MDLSDTQRSAIQEIIETWDPLSGWPRHQPAPGEYDRLIGRICDAIEGDMTADRLAHNVHEEVGQMGVSLDRSAVNNIVQKVHEVLLEKPES